MVEDSHADRPDSLFLVSFLPITDLCKILMTKEVFMKKYFLFFVISGLLSYAHAEECFDSSVVSPSPFMGNSGEIFKLSDGSIWEVKYEYEYLYEYSPEVIICPSKGQLIIGGKKINIERVGGRKASATKGKPHSPVSSDVVESQIEGDFKGWDGETIFKLTNGQIWQQSSYAYTYYYKYRPKVIIFPANGFFSMQVDGVSQRIQVVRIK